MTQEQRGAMRKRNLRHRLQANYPLLAEEFEREALAAQPGYYAGERPPEAEARLAALLAAERERMERLLARPGEVMRYE